MSALPRPDLPPGAHRELVDALHDLHHRAGWPSLRRMAAAVGFSHTTVSKAFSSPSLPAWGVLELLVETLGGGVSTFHEIWLRASVPDGDPLSLPVTRIAGRRSELATVRAHVEQGSGLLLVAGEAGFGKTRLVVTAARTSDVIVAVGHCLPLSTQAPLMPISEVLRTLHEVDDGRLLEEALATEPPYVRESLGRLLPELVGEGQSPASTDEFSRQRLFSAVARSLSGMHALSPFGLLVEDLHWADTTTLDLLEHLVAGGLEVPVVGTWRLHDPDTDRPQCEWWHRTRRLTSVTTFELSPLTRDESAEQCRLLGLDLDEAAVDLIHGRSRGQPLFTEQLATQAQSGEDLPVVLADLLDRRLDRLDESALVITRALGIADRGLVPAVLASATRLASRDLVEGLRDLTRLHLLAQATDSDEVQLRHPLLAEAVRRRLVPGEAADVHRCLAGALGAEPGVSPSEVAEHWRGAGDREQELEWRISAARAASAQWAASQAADQWSRAHEIWPDSRTCAGDPPLTRPEVYLAAIDALKDSLQFDRAAAMSADAAAHFPDLEPPLRAEFLRRAAVFRTEVEGPEVGLELIAEAIRLLSASRAGVGMVRAMARKHQLLIKSGRHGEAVALAREVAVAAEAAGDRHTQRMMLGHIAWYDVVVNGALEQGERTMAHARSLSPASEDPSGEIFLSVIWTDTLLVSGAGSADVVAAGRDALTLAEEQGIQDFGPVLIRYNMAKALIDDARVDEATSLLGPVVRQEVDPDRAPLFWLRAALDGLGGRLSEAASTLEALGRDMPQPIHDLDYVAASATVELWRNRPMEAWSWVQPAIEAQVDSTPAAMVLPALVLGARAVADLTARGEGGDGLRPQLVDLHRRAHIGRSEPAARTARALAATWSAELARADGTDAMRLWLAADSEWSTIGRPHDAAYCLWRAAQAAVRSGEGTHAARIIKRAATAARGHEPLLAEIQATLPR